MKTALLVLVGMVALIAAPSAALAGGGSKATGTVQIRNNSGFDTLVVLAASNNPLTNINALAGGETEADVRAAAAADNAKIIRVNSGATGNFTGLQAGTYNIVATDLDAGVIGVNLGAITGTATVTKGKTVTKTITAGGTITP